MHKYLTLLFLALVICSCKASTNDYAILPTSEGPALIRQCSRRSPQNVTDYWTPTAAQIAQMEKLLPAFLSKSGFKRPFAKFSRQYVGITVQGKQLIYLSAFPSVITERDKDWRTRAVMICDGGEAFWGIVFDPSDNSFQDFATNGVG